MTQFSEILRRAGIDEDWLQWTARAACLGLGQMFDVELPSNDEMTGPVKAAKRICAGCEVRAECLGFALRTEGDDGFRDEVLGGLTGGERERISHEPVPFDAGVALFEQQRILYPELDRIDGGDEPWQKSQRSWSEPLTPNDEF